MLTVPLPIMSLLATVKNILYIPLCVGQCQKIFLRYFVRAPGTSFHSQAFQPGCGSGLRCLDQYADAVVLESDLGILFGSGNFDCLLAIIAFL